METYRRIVVATLFATITFIYLDEMDYMADADFDTISALTAERSDIGMAVSSTPTGHRSRFWQLCTNEKLGLKI